MSMGNTLEGRGVMGKENTKALANRLRRVIGTVISEVQSVVKDRQILDGILIANEVVDEARKLRKDLMLFKVDFEKACDFVDWNYLEVVVGRMSYPASVLLNGSQVDEFHVKRGLR